ncbi:MAG: hypothetical protein KKA44_01195 [Alphaproteobacteria bacterium]|nr:hypothetical protein [Alphaproteobacteria bacterium]MBU0866216.1 hypothetical protein [Alphaproteobacteria bacterium]MBU1823580.1 hypothetical protein [Alphaproteobacteria bacterium]
MLLNDDQIALLQEFIDHADAGVYDAWDIIPKEYHEYFSGPIKHGEAFKKAVDDGRFKSVVWLGMNKSSKHFRYSLHGARVPENEKILR